MRTSRTLRLSEPGWPEAPALDLPATVEAVADASATDPPTTAVASALAGALVGNVGPLDRDGRRAVEVVVDGWRFVFQVEDAERADLRVRASGRGAASAGDDGPVEIRAIIPGRVVAVGVAVGDHVERGGPLLVVEAMKMQNELVAPRAGEVLRVAVGTGSTVDLGDLLVILG